jgi:cytochrome c oxidase subunit 2
MKSLSAFLGLPANASAQGAGLDQLLIAVHVLMFLLFAAWLCYFLYVLVRYSKARNPKADYKGVTSHASSYAEGIVALIEAGLLVGLALPVWARAVEHFPSTQDSTVIHLVAQQFQWNAWYPGTNGVFVKADRKYVAGDNPLGFDKSDPNYKDNFVVAKDFVVPVDKPVIVYISSLDVIHSFACRPMRVMQDAIPGMLIPAHFTPKVPGTYMINCAQLCGAGHYSMKGTVKVVSAGEYQKWVAAKSKAGAGAGAGYE